MNILAPSLAESYLYAEMYNRGFDGGSDAPEKITTAGVPVTQFITGFNEQNGGAGEVVGILAGKTIPAGLALDLRRNRRDIEYEPHLEEGSSGVISDELFDRLFDSVSRGKGSRNNNTTARRQSGPKSDSSRKKHNK